MTHLSAAQLTQLQSLLRNRKHLLLDDLQRDAKALRDDSALAREPGTDGGEHSTSDHAAAVSASELARDATELQGIEQAFVRLAHGDYGVCMACAQPIEVTRLLANPIALRCLDCQERHEKQHPGMAAHTL